MKVVDLQIARGTNPLKPLKSGKPVKPRESCDLEKGNLKENLFSEIYHEKLTNQRLRFSAHAIRRLDERQISLTANDLSRLEDGVNLVEEKGAKSSLILMDKRAYIVSVKNRTVVTTLTEEAISGNVFTNIDSVAVM